MVDIAPNPALLANLHGKTCLITGALGGIGLATASHLLTHNANVVLADLPATASTATTFIKALSPEAQFRTAFCPVDILNWAEMSRLFKETVGKFGRLDVVVANAGIMETKAFFDLDEEVDENGELREPVEAWNVVDVNLKGTMNTLRLAMHHMRTNTPGPDGSRGSIVLVASTAGYFGGTGVVSYVASKHGIMGLLRSSQPAALKYNIRLNAVAPFVTPTHITASYWPKWQASGLPMNTPEDVALAIAQTAADPEMKAKSCLVAGQRMRELETFHTGIVPQMLGPETTELMLKATQFFDELGGYPLPKPRAPKPTG